MQVEVEEQGKNCYLQKIEELFLHGQVCCCICLTRVGASHLPRGHIFHSVFKTWMLSLSASTAIVNILKALGGNQLKIVVVAEVSMLCTQFLVLLDSRLQAMYKPDEPFRGISILLIGDFVQPPLTTGCNLWSVMYGTVTGNDATSRNLFQLFLVHEWTTNMRAADCITHTRHIANCCILSPKYPSRQKWTAKDNTRYRPITSKNCKW